ncbi:MAG: hypothetical protein H7Y27_16675 [Gemmatimonadaceae bacterium]|nr:hypothetical protein [Chitinophagaceae bacterium]
MQGHKFEQQIQQKMDELRLKPSAAVWPDVERQIREKRSKRRVIFWIWLPLLLAVISAAGYMYFRTENELVSADPKTNVATTETTHPKETSDIASSSGSPVRQATEADLPNLSNATPGSALTGINKQKASVGKESLSGTEKNTTQQRKNNSRKPAPVPASAPPFASVPETPEKLSEPTGTETKDQPSNDPPIEKSNTAGEVLSTDSLQTPALPGQKLHPGVDSLNAQDSAAAATTVKLKKKKAWQWGVEGGIGISNNNNGRIFGESKSLDAIRQNSPSGNFNMPGANFSLEGPTISEGTAFNIGVYGKRQLNKRFSLTIGAGYAQLTSFRQPFNATGVSTGNTANFVQTNTALFYRPVMHSYTNRHHFLRASVVLNTKLNKGKLIPLAWNLGITPSWMVSTNALHFDPSTLSYYRDQSLFNKLQTGITTGFSATLMKNKKFPVTVGPNIEYQFTNLLKKSGGNGEQHFIYGSIQLMVPLRK